MTNSGIVSIFISALCSGVVTIFFLGYIKRYLDKQLEAAETERAEREKYQKRRSLANSKLRRAEGRLFFWMHRAIVTPPANGELEKAMNSYNEAEDDESKVIDQEIVAAYELNK